MTEDEALKTANEYTNTTFMKLREALKQDKGYIWEDIRDEYKEKLLSGGTSLKEDLERFINTLSLPAQKTRAINSLKDQELINKISRNEKSRSEIHIKEYTTKDNKTFTISEHRIYDGLNNGNTYMTANKYEYDYFNFLKSKI